MQGKKKKVHSVEWAALAMKYAMAHWEEMEKIGKNTTATWYLQNAPKPLLEWKDGPNESKFYETVFNIPMPKFQSQLGRGFRLHDPDEVEPLAAETFDYPEYRTFYPPEAINDHPTLGLDGVWHALESNLSEYRTFMQQHFKGELDMVDLNKLFGERVKPGTKKKRLIVAASGWEKVGKTHFSFTAPGPIVYFNIDKGEEGVIEKFAGDKEIHEIKLSLPEPKAANPQQSAQDQWKLFNEKYQLALESSLAEGGVRTIIIDTETDLWALARFAELGKLTQVQPHNYVQVNAVYKGMLMKALGYPVNFILLDKWKIDFDTKKPERAGFSELGFMAQVVVDLIKTRGDGETISSTTSVRVLECRHNRDIEGMTFEEPVTDFASIAQAVMPDSTEEDWV